VDALRGDQERPSVRADAVGNLLAFNRHDRAGVLRIQVAVQGLQSHRRTRSSGWPA
jgi:hypothetical protein